MASGIISATKLSKQLQMAPIEYAGEIKLATQKEGG